ncbi:MAG: hypothetical protein HC922_08110 [Leptolyngbyaceae cyanobacterium SM2_3_12]|nr:hypothetical protein [Leptolyngbyaceae cyanobacterium SM2_3_12]
MASCLLALGSGAHVKAESLTSSSLSQAETTPQPVFPAIGQYLFGQVPEPDQFGQGYMVLESTGNGVYGALYYPRSSFDCFYGQVQGAELAMNVINSYSQEVYPYSVALVSNTAVASASLAEEPIAPLNLSGFHQINDLSGNDLRMLEVCQGVVAPQM